MAFSFLLASSSSFFSRAILLLLFFLACPNRSQHHFQHQSEQQQQYVQCQTSTPLQGVLASIPSTSQLATFESLNDIQNGASQLQMLAFCVCRLSCVQYASYSYTKVQCVSLDFPSFVILKLKLQKQIGKVNNVTSCSFYFRIHNKKNWGNSKKDTVHCI